MTVRIPTQLPSKTIQANVDLLIRREVVGLDKYGATLSDAKLPQPALLQHALEEALDLANYLQACLQGLAILQLQYNDLKGRLEAQVIRRNQNLTSGLRTMEQVLDDHNLEAVRLAAKG